MDNIQSPAGTFLPLSEGERAEALAYNAAVDDALAGRSRRSESVFYSEVYNSARLLLDAEDSKALIVIATAVDHSTGRVGSVQALFGEGAADNPTEIMDAHEVRTLMETGVRVVSPMNEDLSHLFAPLH